MIITPPNINFPTRNEACNSGLDSFLHSLRSIADKEEWKKRSVYQLLTDRFARNDGQQYGCDNLGKVPIIKATTAEADTGVLSITWTIFREWASTRSGFLQSSITETEGIMDIGDEICTN